MVPILPFIKTITWLNILTIVLLLSRKIVTIFIAMPPKYKWYLVSKKIVFKSDEYL